MDKYPREPSEWEILAKNIFKAIAIVGIFLLILWIFGVI